ncbi:hypothetical protein [Microbispora sp. H11081]|uniref:hypothetical protein n=1 Tax=Microbispora sp. H11081 TaxID=2729107 RepID=UPI0014736997|nr:hypothetical protein [Microbispora sp. H11081]
MSKNLVIGGLLSAAFAMVLPVSSAHAVTSDATSSHALTAQTAQAAANRAAAPPIHWGPVRSKSGHHGYAAADVWLTRFTAETFVVSGTLRDRDAHSGHCAYVRARFHYVGGGTGWARPKSTCASRASFRLSSDGQVKRVDVKVCVLDKQRRTTLRCHADAITPAIIANWPQ